MSGERLAEPSCCQAINSAEGAEAAHSLRRHASAEFLLLIHARDLQAADPEAEVCEGVTGAALVAALAARDNFSKYTLRVRPRKHTSEPFTHLSLEISLSQKYASIQVGQAGWQAAERAATPRGWRRQADASVAAGNPHCGSTRTCQIAGGPLMARLLPASQGQPRRSSPAAPAVAATEHDRVHHP